MEELQTALTTAFSGISSDVMDVLIIVVPVALGIWAAILAVKYGKKFFGTVSK